MRPFLCNLQNSLSKDRVRPCKPRPGILFNIINIDRLVHETQETRVPDKIDTLDNLGIRVGGLGLDEKGHRPGVLKADCIAFVRNCLSV